MDQANVPTPKATENPSRTPSPFDGPTDDAVDLDFGILEPQVLASLAQHGRSTAGASRLLPLDEVWRRSAERKRQRVPLPLCEFLAYKAALAYEKEAVIESNLGNATDFTFFDSSDTVVDTQGYGFRYDGAAFIVMRGTESHADWTVNLDDTLTGSLLGKQSTWQLWRLRWRYGKGVLPLIDRIKYVPGRHRGFAIAWAAIDDKVMKFVEKLPPRTPIVISGHSLGGALAQIGAYELQRSGHDVAAVVTFGAPLVGNDEFKRLYDIRLKDRTILLEAKGDSVPLIMRRWYYRLNRELQQFVMNLLQPPDGRTAKQNFQLLGEPWPFTKEPSLRDRDIEDAIESIIAARKRAEQAADENRKKAEQDATERAKKSATSNDKTPQPKPAGDTSRESPAGSSKPGTPGEVKPASEGAGQTVLMIIAAIAIIIILLFLWIFVARKLSSHAIMHRYALYLSTLSYQRIRSFHAGNHDAMEANLKLADAELDQYLRFIRGVKGDYKGTFYEKVGDLPVRLKASYDLATFSSEPKNII